MGDQQGFGIAATHAGQTEQHPSTIPPTTARRQRLLAAFAGLIATGLIVYPILDPADSGARERRAGAAAPAGANPLSDLSDLFRELTVHNVAAMAPALPNLPALPALPNIPAAIEQTLKIKAGGTLMNALLDVGFARSDAHEAVSAMGQVADLRALQVGQPVTVTMTPKVGKEAPNLIAVSLRVSPEKEAIVRRGGTEENFVPETVETPLAHAFARAAGTIDDSLYMAAQRAGVPELVIMEMIKMFSWDVDFQRDIQPGDRFEVLFERYHDDTGEAVKLGHIIHASLTLSGTDYRLYRHTMKDGTVDYFNDKGDSVKKALLRTPIDGAKLTSGFGARRHPILGYTRMHQGVDFGAPAGTPIMAAGDGVVEKAGINSGYGNFVQIRHNGQFSTGYAHLSRFGKGITAGRRVRQGDIIGYVGSTGLATGPHLHYEVYENNRQVNPQGVKLPTGVKLKGADLALFAAARAKIELTIAATPVLATRTAQNDRQ